MSYRWLNAKEAAAKMHRTTRVFRERIALLPGFPAPFRPGGTGHPLWREDQIDEWMERGRKAQAGQRDQPSLSATSSIRG